MNNKTSQIEILNAKITSTSITMADHGCLTFWITVEGGGWGVSIGGYSIGRGYLGADEFHGYGPGLEAMMRIMDVVGVDKWEDLNGKYIRVESNGWGRTVRKIGHITNDKWFDIDEFFKSKDKKDYFHVCATCAHRKNIYGYSQCYAQKNAPKIENLDNSCDAWKASDEE